MAPLIVLQSCEDRFLLSFLFVERIHLGRRLHFFLCAGFQSCRNRREEKNDAAMLFFSSSMMMSCFFPGKLENTTKQHRANNNNRNSQSILRRHIVESQEELEGAYYCGWRLEAWKRKTYSIYMKNHEDEVLLFVSRCCRCYDGTYSTRRRGKERNCPTVVDGAPPKT